MFKTLLQYYLSEFERVGEPILKTICNCSVPSTVILNAYKSLPPIEMMDDREKKEMKQYVIETFPDKTIEEKLNCCKIVYTIGTLL